MNGFHKFLLEEGFRIFKDHITDSGVKKSSIGLLKVKESIEGLELIDNLSDFNEWYNDTSNALKTVYKDGKFELVVNIQQIRDRVNNLLV